MLRRTLLLSVVLVSLAFFIEGQQSRQSSRTRTSQIRKRVSKRKPITPPVSSFVTDSDSRELIVRVLDVGQGDAIYIRNGSTRVIIDGGPDHTLFGRYLDSLRLNNSTIDVVILTHQHLDHYSGLQELFRTDRHIHVRYFFENKDPAPAVTLAHLRDSILSRMDLDSLIYRDTDDPCSNGRPICTITMNGGAKLHLLAPQPDGEGPNNRSAAVKLIGPDSASFTMWLAGDAEHEEISWFQRAGYDTNPGMRVRNAERRLHSYSRTRRHQPQRPQRPNITPTRLHLELDVPSAISFRFPRYLPRRFLHRFFSSHWISLDQKRRPPFLSIVSNRQHIALLHTVGKNPDGDRRDSSSVDFD